MPGADIESDHVLLWGQIKEQLKRETRRYKNIRLNKVVLRKNTGIEKNDTG